jgi:hypothetical protein
MRRVYQLLIINQDQERTVKLTNDWVPVNPSYWRENFDCTVSVALGQGNKDQQVGQLNSVLQMATQAQNAGNPMIGPENIYNISASLLKAMGMQNVDDFLTPPDQQKPPGPTPEEQKDQAEIQMGQAEVKIKEGKLQLDQQEFQHQQQQDAMELQLKAAELETEMQTGRPVKLG